MNNQSLESQRKIVAEQWTEKLKEQGYEHHVASALDCRQLKLSRIWRRLFKIIKVDRSRRLRILEAGCGGGIHLARLAARGHECTGVDVSEEVLQRAANYLDEVRKVCGLKMDIRLVSGDFLTISEEEVGGNFDLVFNFGVIEHFLDDETRGQFLKKKYELTGEGGYIVSIVPNGCHPLREKMRKYGLGGYNIPEIDYDHRLMEKELKAMGAAEIVVLPHNLFGYLLLETDNRLVRLLKKMVFWGMQIIPPAIFPTNFGYRHAGILIGIARKFR